MRLCRRDRLRRKADVACSTFPDPSGSWSSQDHLRGPPDGGLQDHWKMQEVCGLPQGDRQPVSSLRQSPHPSARPTAVGNRPLVVGRDPRPGAPRMVRAPSSWRLLGLFASAAERAPFSPAADSLSVKGVSVPGHPASEPPQRKTLHYCRAVPSLLTALSRECPATMLRRLENPQTPATPAKEGHKRASGVVSVCGVHRKKIRSGELLRQLLEIVSHASRESEPVILAGQRDPVGILLKLHGYKRLVAIGPLVNARRTSSFLSFAFCRKSNRLRVETGLWGSKTSSRSVGHTSSKLAAPLRPPSALFIACSMAFPKTSATQAATELEDS
ncbi:hypothetical protein DFJ74DRAFT_168078 [Hyaloraphidium curvatum]|nr:hypothetical protein DFJ74DRAFT_168078 [Hyaloraphidium curvatum]